MRVDRLVSIIMILLEQERVGAQVLADLFEVSPRTIYRDIDAINLAGIPVCSIPGVGGGLEIMRQYKLDKTVCSASELWGKLRVPGTAAYPCGTEAQNTSYRRPVRLIFTGSGRRKNGIIIA